MERPVTRRRLLAGGAVTALTSLAGCSGATPFVGKRVESDRTLPLDGVSVLSVLADAGDVRIAGEDRSDAALHVVKKASSVTVDLSNLTLDTETDGDRLRLRTRYDGDVPFFGGTPTMDVSLRVPRSLAVDRVETAVGDVDVRNVTGDLTVDASTGDVHLRNVRGAVGVDTTTGDVVVDGVDVVGDVATTTGDVDLSVSAIPGETQFEATTGDIVTALSPDIDASVTVRVDTGDISAGGLPLTDTTHEDGLLSGTLGNGGTDLLIETTTGDVTLSALSEGS